MPGSHSDDRPHPLGELAKSIDSEITILNAKWKLFRQLFLEDDSIEDSEKKKKNYDERINLLKDVAPFFFDVTNRFLLESVMLSVSRLLEKPKTAGQGNASLERLIKDTSHPNLVDGFMEEIAVWLETIKKKAKPIYIFRHKIIAHRDLENALSKESLLPAVTYENIDEVIQSINELMNKVNSKVGYGTVMYSDFEDGGSIHSILFHFEKAKYYFDLHKQVALRKITPEELFEKMKRL